jgi:subfamily B ATP-binding cassette protein MsbA
VNTVSDSGETTDGSLREKAAAIHDAARFRPALGVVIVTLSLGAAMLEGVGLGFLLPIVEVARSPGPPSDATGVLGAFVRLYAALGLPFTLEYLIGGIAAVMTVRVGLGFLSTWLKSRLSLGYQRHLRRRLFEAITYGPVAYVDRTGSDALLNSMITETDRASVIVMAVFNGLEVLLRGLIYLLVAAALSPLLTLVALVGLGASTLSVRYVLEPAYTAGDLIATTNDRIQSIVQTSVQGTRDVRLFTMRERFTEQMRDVLDEYVEAGVRLRRNQAALNGLNTLANAFVVFGLVYAGFRFTGLSLAELGVFLFAVFRLSPILNNLNNQLYRVDGQLPHLLRVRRRCAELDATTAPDAGGGRSVESVDRVEFDDVSFAYGDDPALDGVSFVVERGEKVAFVGPSGAGKSTIVALLARLRTPDGGRILADGTPIDEFDVESWRERLAVVRQHPFLFDGTLRENVTVGADDASRAAVERACEVAQVTEFVDDLPDGYDTDLGEDGVRLSGGQRQRVAIARALLKDADVLVLDEATSELDSNIERAVYRGIQSLEGQYATVGIAHQLSTVNDADRIYTLVDGRVTEVGTHDQLLDREGTYADLYATQ